MNVHCKLLPYSNIYGILPALEVWRESDCLGTVHLGADGDPVLTVFGDKYRTELTFNDLEIIQDNWTQLMELTVKKKSEPMTEGIHHIMIPSWLQAYGFPPYYNLNKIFVDEEEGNGKL